MYEECETLARDDAERILSELKNYREVKVLPHVDNPFVMEAARRALLRAGYDLKI